ncbi:MAG: DEAD/DEAH box helicase family protein [Brevinema sp.]
MKYNLEVHEWFSNSKKWLDNYELPSVISHNLNPSMPIREYQEEAFKRFLAYKDTDFFERQSKHYTFNMATGSGKTLIMAGLILYLYEQGYRNFLFFSTSRQIIEKTRDNFLNQNSGKYLFNDPIAINNELINITEVDNFNFGTEESINIAFTTIHTLHNRLQTPKENAITLEDFQTQKVVLIGDEAHHYNSKTKKTDQFLFDDKNWETTINKILDSHPENYLLEFTATLDFLNTGIVDKYSERIIYKYDLANFRNDKYSKEIFLLQSDMKTKDLILQAVIFNQYKQSLALDYGIPLKPVILFKANRSIKESMENERLFHSIIDNLSISDIESIERTATKNVDAAIIVKAINYFKKKEGLEGLIRIIKLNFDSTKCINVNESENKNELQIVRSQEQLLNSLETAENQIRVIFAVNKLNEGWDVLNLFDIVRIYDKDLYSDKNLSASKNTTNAEAQLIGRGARYYPLSLKEADQTPEYDKYKRKFDHTDHELKILEELYYHSIYNSKYISDLNKTLIEQGLMDDPNNYEEKQLTLKPTFIAKSNYKNTLIYTNKRKKKSSYDRNNLWSNIEYIHTSLEYKIPTGFIVKGQILEGYDQDSKLENEKNYELLKVLDIPLEIKRKALFNNRFFTFINLKKYLRIKSMSDFFDTHFNKIEIRFAGSNEDIDFVKSYNKHTLYQVIHDHNRDDYIVIKQRIIQEFYHALEVLLQNIEKQLKAKITPYKGSKEFTPKPFEQIFKNKILKLIKNSERNDGQENYLADKEWYVYNANYGTDQEKFFIKTFASRIYDDLLGKGYTDIFIIRNELSLPIFNFENGEPFYPDFILIMKKNNKPRYYQLFIEPKGTHLILKDKWKSDLLLQIKKMSNIFTWHDKEYNIIGLDFYNSNKELDFIKEINDII